MQEAYIGFLQREGEREGDDREGGVRGQGGIVQHVFDFPFN